jgi:hypothetical protein
MKQKTDLRADHVNFSIYKVDAASEIIITFDVVVYL